MRWRCRNDKNYAGRGPASRWDDFGNFAVDMGERPPGAELHRKDNDRGYEPGNCVWLTREEHAAAHADQRRRNLSLAS